MRFGLFLACVAAGGAVSAWLRYQDAVASEDALTQFQFQELAGDFQGSLTASVGELFYGARS